MASAGERASDRSPEDNISAPSPPSAPIASTEQVASAQAGASAADAQNTTSPVELSELSRPAQPTHSIPGSAEAQEQQAADHVATAASPDGPAPSTHNAGIGPATDRPSAVATAPSAGPRLIITLLLHSTETRHPYTINEAYLSRRGVTVPDNDPVNMSVYTLKELIWRDWRPEWEPRPSSPSSIRLIHMGRLLDDKEALKDTRFSTGETPHVVHMTVKPQEVVDDEDARVAKGGREREGSERTPRCRCTVM